LAAGRYPRLVRDGEEQGDGGQSGACSRPVAVR